MPTDYLLSQLDVLEAESIHIFREVAATAENPVMLYSVGKDSTVLLHVARPDKWRPADLGGVPGATILRRVPGPGPGT